MTKEQTCLCGTLVNREVRQNYPLGGGHYCSEKCHAVAKDEKRKRKMREQGVSFYIDDSRLRPSRLVEN